MSRVRVLAAGVGALTVASSLVSCSSSTLVQVPPRVDLDRYGTIGIIELSSNTTEDLRQEANRQFLTSMMSAQPGVPVLELGDERQVLDAMQAGALDPATIRAIGEKYDVDVVLIGVLEAREVRPRASLGSALGTLHANAEVEGSLTAKMLHARSGATLWTCTTRDAETIASLTIDEGGLSELGASHPDESHVHLVRTLVKQATDDFRPSYVRQ